MSALEPDLRSDTRRALDEQIAAEPLLAIPDVQADAVRVPMEVLLKRLSRSRAVREGIASGDCSAVRRDHAIIRNQIESEFPPARPSYSVESPPGLPSEIRSAREARGLSWYALAKLAGISNSSTIRDIEAGRDAQLSSVQAVVLALGLKLKLVAEAE